MPHRTSVGKVTAGVLALTVWSFWLVIEVPRLISAASTLQVCFGLGSVIGTVGLAIFGVVRQWERRRSK